MPKNAARSDDAGQLTPAAARAGAMGGRLARLACVQTAIVAVAGALIFGLWFATVLHVESDREEIIAGVVRQNASLASAFERHVANAIKGADRTLRLVRQEYDAQGRRIDLAAFIAHDFVDSESLLNVMILDERGELVASRVATAAAAFADRGYFVHHLQNAGDELFIGKPEVDPVARHWVIPMTRRLNKSDGGFGGVVMLAFNPDQLVNFYESGDLGRGGMVDLVGFDGVSRMRQSGREKTFGSAWSAGALSQMVAQGSGHLAGGGAGDAVDRFVSYRRLTPYSLLVAVGIAQDEVLAPLRRDANGYYLIAAIVTLVMVLFTKVLMSAVSSDKHGVEALVRSEARYRAAFSQAAVGIAQTSLDGRFLEVNQALCNMVGFDAREMLERSVQDMLHPDDTQGSIDHLVRLLAGKENQKPVASRYRHKDGSAIWLEVASALVRDADDAPDYFVHMIECITERKRLQDNLEHLARHDSLTQLPNRSLFYNRLQHALGQARRRNWLTGVMFIDLDRFKAVNDTLGHAVGDQLLQQVAVRLMRCVRADDTVGRLGGDEFAVVLSELSQENSAALVAQKILDALGQPFQLEKHEVFVTVSIGIATCGAGECDVDSMISNADAAMYDAKKLGRNNYQFYAATMSERAMEKLLLEKELRYALARNEMLLNFQPKVSLKSGEITGFEALLRWHRTGGEIVSPALFIPVVEDCGLIEEIGEWVLRGACAQIVAWQKAGLQPVPVAVNLSPKQFQRNDIADTIRRALHDYAIDPALLELEITESAAMDDAEGAIAALANLKALGVRISIDDFGTGYSSLSYLTRFPIDCLKIDRSFVINLPDSEDGASIARAVINMAQSLRLKVVAEGVETAAQLEFLAANYCDDIQGYYCSRPLPAAQATELLTTRRRLLPRPQLVSAVAA